MRLFVALVPPPVVLAALPPAPAGLRATPAAQLHLTLAFLGEVPSADGLLLGLEAVTGLAAPELRLAGSGSFGSAVWLGVHGDLLSLRRLARTAQDVAGQCGVEVDRHQWRPHLTIGRGRVPAAFEAYEGPTARWGEVRLVRSRLGGGGARHETLAAWTVLPLSPS
ncbi:MAG: 2,3-cyclic 3-phosphodiesterase [Frankiales bacterium]|jgi:2'-5' RNA ligase|nr:2,3-cyclic 3-phosphodiesterase [Frankiales bacterium]MDX6257685.1 2,3-cyclic 3-phosphodiesterase [Frankiales bacterium]